MDTQLLPYRLKSARRKKRLQIQDRDKQILKLDREQRQIWNNPDLKVTVPLDEHYQRGWVRLFVLKPEVQKSAQAEFYQKILDEINQYQYHFDASFKKTRRKTYRHRYNFDLPKLRTISRYDWNMNKAELTEEQRACFNKVEFWDAQRYAMTYKYEFAYPELLEIKVKPHIVTTVKEVDTLLMQRMHYIKDYLNEHGFEYRLCALGKGYKRWNNKMFEKLKYVNKLKNKPMQDWLTLNEE